jgi:predicted membrane protein
MQVLLVILLIQNLTVLVSNLLILREFVVGKVKEDLEFYSVMRSVRAIEHADICILIIDATRGFEGQDQSIFG